MGKLTKKMRLMNPDGKGKQPLQTAGISGSLGAFLTDSIPVYPSP